MEKFNETAGKTAKTEPKQNGYDILSDVVESGIKILPRHFFADNNLVKGEDFICLGQTDENPLPYYAYTYVYVLPKYNHYKVYIEN